MKKHIAFPIISAFLLTFVGGYCDAYTFVYRNGMFANMQTGNLIKFLIQLANGDFNPALFLPIVFFCLGCIACILINKFKFSAYIVLITLFAVYLATGFSPRNDLWDVICVCSLSFVGAMQFQAFRTCVLYTYTSTMCTNNMRLFCESIVGIFADKNIKRALFYLLIIVAFSVGCVVAVFIGKGMDIRTISVASSLFIVVFILSLFTKNIEVTEAHSNELS